jgi:hypothetical protein
MLMMSPLLHQDVSNRPTLNDGKPAIVQPPLKVPLQFDSSG